MPRVAVTGLGAVTPLGHDAQSTWRAALAGESGIDFIRAFDPSGFPVTIAAEVTDFDGSAAGSPKELRRLDRNVVLALAAAREAAADARLDGLDPNRVGIVVGSAIGGIAGIEEQAAVYRERGHDRVSPFFIPSVLVDSASGQLAISLGYRGPNHAVVSACATGSSAIGEAAELVRRGDADAVLAGGTEAAITPLILAGFCAMRGLAAEDEHPPRASRPFDATRAGFVMGEGACVLVLEDLDAARKRGATIYGEMLGYGVVQRRPPHGPAGARGDRGGGDDARGVAASGRRAGAGRLRQRARHRHAARRRGRDEGDQGRLRRPRLPARRLVDEVDDGHCFGAAGAIEAMMCVLALRDGVLPPTINYREPDPDCDLDYVPNEARRVQVDVARSRTRWASAATTAAC